MALSVAELDQQVLGWLQEARLSILDQLKQPMQVNQKTSHRDLVTNVDKRIEQFYIKKIHDFMPNASVISEEGYGDEVTKLDGDVWFVDPIDGTLNFVEQHHEFATMLALYHDGKPVLAWIMDVMNNEVVHGGPTIGVFVNKQHVDGFADKALSDGLIVMSGARLLGNQIGLPEIAKEALGFRVYGSAGISYCHVMKGQALGYISVMKPWDFAPGIALALTLGLAVTDVDGHAVDMLSSGTVVVSTPSSHEDIMRIENQLKSV